MINVSMDIYWMECPLHFLYFWIMTWNLPEEKKERSLELKWYERLSFSSAVSDLWQKPLLHPRNFEKSNKQLICSANFILNTLLWALIYDQSWHFWLKLPQNRKQDCTFFANEQSENVSKSRKLMLYVCITHMQAWQILLLWQYFSLQGWRAPLSPGHSWTPNTVRVR